MINYRCTRSRYEINIVNITNIDEPRYKSPPSTKWLELDSFWIMVIDRMVDHS
jgi:hypothetical protein